MQRTLPEELFLGILCLERKRAERSRKRFLLVLIDAEDAVNTDRHAQILGGVVRAADASRRETDPAGWYKDRAILGIMFTELGAAEDAAAVRRLEEKVHGALAAELSPEDLRLIIVSIHIFGSDFGDGDDISADPIFYPDLIHLHESKKLPFVLKRVMDVAGSLAAIIVLSPVFLLIAMAIKLTSKGPVLYKQERLGRFGKTFTCMKFRSMKSDSNSRIHQEFIAQVIKGTYEGNPVEGAPVYKMTRDPRVTRVGQFIRRTSLDELPQFFNVLQGEMSLVGPRPPIAYEYKEYDVWHRRRVLEVKPGITGLWQVRGRSRVRFDDMVRLDLQYARGWSLWLDIRILLATPRAVAFGGDAY